MLFLQSSPTLSCPSQAFCPRSTGIAVFINFKKSTTICSAPYPGKLCEIPRPPQLGATAGCS